MPNLSMAEPRWMTIAPDTLNEIANFKKNHRQSQLTVLAIRALETLSKDEQKEDYFAAVGHLYAYAQENPESIEILPILEALRQQEEIKTVTGTLNSVIHCIKDKWGIPEAAKQFKKQYVAICGEKILCTDKNIEIVAEKVSDWQKKHGQNYPGRIIFVPES